MGQALAKGFAGLGWHVIAVDRSFDDSPGMEGIQQVVTDLAEGVPEEAPAVEVVVHGAWYTGDPVSPGIPMAEYLSVNVRPLLAALEFATRSRAASFVFLSSSGVFGPHDGEEGLTDADRPTGASPYSVGKRVCEDLVAAALDTFPDVETTAYVVRLGYLYGLDERPRPTRPGVSVVARWLDAAREGRPLEVPSEGPLRDWTFAPDLAPALERLVDGPSAGHPIHLASPFVLRDRALAELLASQLPGTEVITVPAGPEGRPFTKPPMVPSDVSALRDFPWTGPMTGLHAVLGAETDLLNSLGPSRAAGGAPE